MVDAAFDGINLIITLPAGEGEISVETDLYSAWKRFLLVDKRNMRFPEAFRTVGGDALTPGIDAGAYFFLQNDKGWRIRPAEEDATVNVVGNLAPEDSTLDMTIPTIGAFTVLLNGLQPITQSVEEILTQQQESDYNGEVAIDVISGTSGTNFPVGTLSSPVDNIVDAITIATNLGLQTFAIRGVITLPQALINWTFRGLGTELNDRVNLNGQNVSGSSFVEVEVAGTMVVPTIGVDIIAGRVATLINFRGNIERSAIADDIILEPGQTNIYECYSDAPGLQNVIFDNQDGAVDLFIRGFLGVFQVSNHSNPGSLVSIDLIAGKTTLNPSVNGGSVNIRGVGTLTDNSGVGVTVNKSGFVDGLDIKLIKALDAGNITITGADPFVITVLDPDDDITVIGTWEVSADGLVRTRTS